MKQIALVILVFSLIFFSYTQYRNFYCVNDNTCVTVWKRFDKYYIIPGKYYGLNIPKDNFIESSIANNISIYFHDEQKNSFIYKSEKKVNVKNLDTNNFNIKDYDGNVAEYDQLLYRPGFSKHNDLKTNIELIELFLEESYAIDKCGRKL